MAEGNTDISVSEPKKIGFFSLDINGVFLNNDSKKKTFIEPKRNSDGVLLKPLDLKKGTMTKKRDENKKPKLDNILQWIKLHGRDMQTDFVCKRSLLNKIMSTPYDAKKKLRIDVTLYKGIYYLCNRPKENKPEQTECREEEKWGYKFEQYLTEESTDPLLIPDMDYNSCEAFYNVMKVQVGSHILVYSCEVDAVSTDESGEHSVEFKTIKHSKLDAERIATFKRYNLLTWWIQSFLGGVPKIICGFRDDIEKLDTGIVIKLKTKQTAKIPFESDIKWKTNECFDSLNELLKHIISNVKEDNPRQLLEYPNDKYTVRQRKYYTWRNTSSTYDFLPEWYTL
ncbi:decapping and exoribonuclease protein-like [Mya arenaria]|uniref:decapping and exoribonuclease protein-like n=1 Tax=Mya arenaria TaxID=6604 RepID=UPI0022E1B736|nr:decapping and exoribonuclease protein-like [Mya arenaria]